MNENMWIVDAFTKIAFRGNAAAVCLLDEFPDDASMQLIALQMQLSETAFVVENGPLDYRLRWFTPEVEVDLCGHATLATAHVLKQTGAAKQGDNITFHTLSGPLPVKLLESVIELNFPCQPPAATKAPAALNALHVDIISCEKSGYNYLVEVKDFDTLIHCSPDFKKLKKLEAQGVAITTARGVPAGFDFASRYFAPQVGINEDPVTGSAHCVLGPYWAKKLGKSKLHALQASKGYGILDVTMAGDRVLIAGNCVTTLKGPLPKAKTQKAVKEKETAA